MLKTGKNKVFKDGDGRADEMIIDFSKFKKLKNNKSRNLTNVLNDKAMEKPIFLTSSIKKVFNFLKQAFIKALIFQYFDPKYYIRIKINALSYAIEKVPSQLNIN